MDAVIKGRVERSFGAFSDQGDYITHDTYVGHAYRLAQSSGQDPSSAKVTDLVQELELMWSQFAGMADTDNDGRISRDDYLVFAEGMTAMLRSVGPDDEWPLDPFIHRLFDLIDADADGSITKDEYAIWLSSMGLAADTDIDAAFAGFDKNHDTKLSWDEFSQCSRQFWTDTDPDGPGARWMGP